MQPIKRMFPRRLPVMMRIRRRHTLFRQQRIRHIAPMTLPPPPLPMILMHLVPIRTPLQTNRTSLQLRLPRLQTLRIIRGLHPYHLFPPRQSPLLHGQRFQMHTTLPSCRQYRIGSPPAQQVVERNCILNTNLMSRHRTRKQMNPLCHIVNTNSILLPVITMHLLRRSQT